MALIMLSPNVDARSVVMACPAMYTGFEMPFRFAKSSEQRTAAAAPHVGGQHWYRVSGSNTSGEPITSSRDSRSLKIAYGFFDAWARAFSAILPNVSRFVPQRHRYSRAAPPKNWAVGGAWLKPCTWFITAACLSIGFVRSA